jgi:hypothetical protein
MAYEIATPICLEATELARQLADEAETPSQKLGAARVLLSALAHDIKARLAAPKIRAYEAKMIENADTPRLPGASGAAPAPALEALEADRSRI